jgi:putative DNA primase/helicase
VTDAQRKSDAVERAQQDLARQNGGPLAGADEVAERIAADPGPANRGEFNARRLAGRLVTETPVAVAASRTLYVFREGAYRPNGEDNLRARITALLGDEWRKRRADETIAYLRDSAPRLWARPPRDRINVANGILDLGSRRLEPHDPAFLSPVQLGAAYDPDAECPAIDRFLADVLDPELVPLVYELVGYLATPDNALQVAVMLLGEGSNGKSTLLALLTRLLGPENVAAVALHRLDEDRFSAAELEGKLANVFADLDARALQASSIFKAITGGDAISGERKYHPAFRFTPFARLLYSANEPPPTPDSSHAFFRRWLILPFERRFTRDAVDRYILDRLATDSEISGLLNRGLDALPTLLARGGFAATEKTTKAAEQFRTDSDSVAGFLGESYVIDPDPAARIPRANLFQAYRFWCTENNRGALGKQRFNRRIVALYPAVTVVQAAGVEHWQGIRLGEEQR